MSLVDRSQLNPALPSGHPFIDVQNDFYWSATTTASDTARAWLVSLVSGGATDFSKSGGVNGFQP